MPPFEPGKTLRSANDNADPGNERAVLLWRQILASHWPIIASQHRRGLFFKFFSFVRYRRSRAAVKLD
jgi:hypothetical protein